MSSYPKWLYHYRNPPVVVPDEAAHRALGEGWAESPADAIEAQKVPLEKAPEPKKKGK